MTVMNWATLMPTIVGAVVGLAGIGTALASTRMTIRSATQSQQTSLAADEERARYDRKLRIYSAFVGAVNNALYASAVNLTEGGKRPKNSRAEVEAGRLCYDAMTALGAVQLTGPREVGTLGSATMAALADFIAGRVGQVDVLKDLVDVAVAMRMDLGEPGPPGITSLSEYMEHLLDRSESET